MLRRVKSWGSNKRSFPQFSTETQNHREKSIDLKSGIGHNNACECY